MVPVELSKIIISDMLEEQIIVLKEVDGARKFPIVIGVREAREIDRRIKGASPMRPMTYELLDSIIRNLGGTLERVEIVDLKAGTFFAQIIMRRGDERFEIDSRPSDAIALTAGTDVPIHVAEHVLESVA